MVLIKFLLDTGAGLNLKNANCIRQGWVSQIKRTSLSRLRTATRELVYPDGIIQLHSYLGDQRARVWFYIVPNLVVDLLLGTPIIDRFIRGIFPADRKIVCWHSQPVAIPETPKRPADKIPTCALLHATTERNVDWADNLLDCSHPVPVAWQLELRNNLLTHQTPRIV